MSDSPDVSELVLSTALLSVEEPIIQLNRQQDKREDLTNKSLVGRFISQKPCSIAAIKNNALRVWKLKGDLRVCSLQKENSFLFSFFEEEDKLRVQEDSPWPLMQSHVVLKDWGDVESPDEVRIDSTQAWVRLIGLTPDLRSRENIAAIATLFKGCVDIDEDGLVDGEWNSTMRVKMDILIEKPLPTGCQCPGNNGKVDRVEFVYENIPDFCYCCGIMGHTISYCKIRSRNEMFFHENPTKYGVHMRVEVSRRQEGSRSRTKNKGKEKIAGEHSSEKPSPVNTIPKKGNTADLSLLHADILSPTHPNLQNLHTFPQISQTSSLFSRPQPSLYETLPKHLKQPNPLHQTHPSPAQTKWSGLNHPQHFLHDSFLDLSQYYLLQPNNIRILHCLAIYHTRLTPTELKEIPIPFLVNYLLKLKNPHITETVLRLNPNHPEFQPSCKNPFDLELPYTRPDRLCWQNMCGKRKETLSIEENGNKRLKERSSDTWLRSEDVNQNMESMFSIGTYSSRPKPRKFCQVKQITNAKIRSEGETTDEMEEEAQVAAEMPPNQI